MNPNQIQQLRKEAEAEAKQILKHKKKFGGKEFEAKNHIIKRKESSLHSLLPQETINHCINNNLDIEYLYEELLSKYNGSLGEKKSYYVPNGGKRGRPKQNKDEQEQ